MSRRIDIELTSALPDGSWTWRAAGAKKPNGVLDGGLLPSGSAVGDVLKVEVEQMLDGIEVQSLVKGREKASDDNLLELLPSEKPFEAVIETRAKRERSERRDGRDNRDGRDGRDGRGKRPRGDGRTDGRRGDGGKGGGQGGQDGGKDGRDGDQRRSSQRRDRPHFDAPPELPQRPKPKRLRPGKARRSAVLAELPEEQRPIAEMALQGMAAVRSRVKEENAKLTEAGKPTMPEASVVKMAEELLPKLRVAEWLDRAEAAQRQIEHLDLRDLRSVVAASDDSIVARDESTRAIAEELKAALVRKQDEELTLWFGDIDAAIGVGRVIRALRLSSQPPKAGVMFPPELARRLSEATTAALLPDDPADRWIAVLEAVAFSPVRTLVTPTTGPTAMTDDLRATVVRLGPALPQFAALLGVEIPAGTPKPKPLRPGPPRKDGRSDGRGDGRARRESKPRPPRQGESPKNVKKDVPADTATQPVKDAPAETPSSSEAPTDAPTDAVVETPIETSAATPAEVPTEAPAEVPTEAPADAPTDAVVEAPIETSPEAPAEVPTEAPVEAPAEISAAVPADAPVEAPADAAEPVPESEPTTQA